VAIDGALPTSSRRKAAFAAIALLVGSAAAFALAELLVRVVGPPRLVSKRWLRDLSDPSAAWLCYPSNPHGELSPPPDTSRGDWHLYAITLPPEEMPLDRLRETPFCVRQERVTVDEGLRLRTPPPREPAEGRLRLVGAGDSFAYGEGVPVEKSLFRQVAALLGPGHEVIDAARSGLYTAHEVPIVTDAVTRFHATRAVVVFVPNDVALSPALAARQDWVNDLINLRDRYLHARLGPLAHSRLVELIVGTASARRAGRETVRWYLDAYDPAQNGANLDALARDFTTLARLPGCRVALVIHPLLERLDGDYPFTPIHERVAAMAKSAGLPVLDLTAALRGVATRDLWVHETDHHPNGRAHAIAARTIVDWLRTQPGFLTR
jgi:hypothetical protein